jgi:alkylhydroperoxidase/carboxymuconolactone decarboxylase family protein YurZ
MPSRNKNYLKKLRKERGYLLESHEFLASNDPGFLRNYNSLFEYLMTEDRHTSIKVKELIVIALLSSKGQYRAAELHVKRALDHGATPMEVLEAMEVALLYSGAPSLIYGAEALIKHLKKIGRVQPGTMKIR